MRRVVAGIGCTSRCPAADVLAALAQACASAGRSADAMAAPRFKAGQTILDEAARRAGLALLLVDDDALAQMQPLCPTRSARAQRASGFAAISEASALAAAGPGARLLLPRIAVGQATCALAEAAS